MPLGEPEEAVAVVLALTNDSIPSLELACTPDERWFAATYAVLSP